MDTTETTTETETTTTASTTVHKKISKLSILSKDHIGQLVKLHGWVYGCRQGGAGSLVFVDLNDGTTVTPIRCIATQQEQEQASDAEEEDNEQQLVYYGSTNLLLSHGANDDETSYTRLTFDEMTQASSLSIGCSIMVFGHVSEPPHGTTQKFEIQILELFVIGSIPDPTKYPITKSIMKNPVTMRSLYHTRFRAPLIQQIMYIRSQTLFAIHEFFHSEGVPLLDPNIMTSSDCEGAGEVFKVTPQFFTSSSSPTTPPAVEQKKPTKKKKKKGSGGGGEKGQGEKGEGQEHDVAKDDDDDEKPSSKEESKPGGEEAPTKQEEDSAAAETEAPTPSSIVEVGLTVSSQLPLEAISMGTGSVYTCQKSFRAEKSDTNKHLAEFIHVEYEQYFITLDELLDQAERYVKHVIGTVLDRCTEQYDFFDQRHLAPNEFHGHRDYLRSLLDKPFIRMKHADAITEMQQDVRDKVKTVNDQGKEVRLKFKEKPQHGCDLGSEHEKYLVRKYGTFVFVTHWPSAIKSFYMKQVGDGTCESFDLLAPIVGELFGGSMREWRYDVLSEFMKEKEMDFGPLQWFVDLRRNGGTAPHGGWGMGFDRFVMFLTNTNSVRDVVPYPVYWKHCPY